MPVDWKTLKIRSTNPAFRLAPTQASASEVTTAVRCTLPDRVTDLKAFVSISVARIGHHETPDADRLTGEVSLSTGGPSTSQRRLRAFPSFLVSLERMRVRVYCSPANASPTRARCKPSQSVDI